MKSLLRVGTALAVVMAAGLAYAGDSQWKQGGVLRYRSEQFDNSKFKDERRDYSWIQFRWDLTFQPNDMTSIFFQPKYAKKAGSPAGVSGGGTDPDLTIHQAYFLHKFNDTTSVKVGRQEFKYGDQLVIGPVGWANVGRSFDAVKARYTMDKLWVDLFTAKIEDREGDPANAHPVDKDFSGLYMNYSGVPFANAIDLYYLMDGDNAKTINGTDPDKALTATGLRVKSKIGAVDYRLEYTMEGGTVSTADVEDATQYDVEVGYSFSGDLKARLSVEMFNASKNYTQLYPTAHKWLGFMDLFRRTNIAGTVVHVKVPWNDFVFKLDYHMLSRADDATSMVNFGGGAYGTTGTDTAAGAEMDLTIKYKSSAAMGWALGYSTFTPGDYLKAQTSAVNMAEAVTFVYLQMLAKF